MKRNQKGFTLMELMVVIVIVAILAAVAVPLYINYVKDAQLTEAKGAIGAIISAEQAAFQRSSIDAPPATYASLGDLETAGLVDVREAKMRWKFETSAVTPQGYVITAKFKSDETIAVTYTFLRPDENGLNGTAEFNR